MPGESPAVAGMRSQRRDSAEVWHRMCTGHVAVAGGDVILTVLARQRQPIMPPSIITPDALRLKHEPVADCGRYDSIRKIA